MDCRSFTSRSLFTLLIVLPLQHVQAASLTELTSFSMEELLGQEVTSVSRKQQNLYTAPAAVYVITAEDIRRHGASNLPEALAMAPGLMVREIDGNNWSIGSRGHSGIYSNKLLVLIDGRSIYTPTFSGVYWDQHNIPMHEIDRIEVVRGSGATLWGANAVNGIINIITKHASDSQGGYLEASAGNQNKGSVSIRYGGEISETTQFRVNANTSERDSNTRYDGSGSSEDSASNRSISFHIDGSPSKMNTWGVTGGFHDNEHKQSLSVFNTPPTVPPFAFYQADVSDEVEIKNYYLKGNWNHFHNNGAESSFQFYIDDYDREEIYLTQDVRTYDLDYQLTLPAMGNHSLILGAGYRTIDAKYKNSYAVSILPDVTDLDLFSTFIQDEYTFIPDKFLMTVGSKFEHHDYTGWEVQPNLRFAYTPVPGHFSWVAISKAVRTPSIAERGSNIQGGITVPITTWVQGNANNESEDVTSYEVGYRYYSSNHYTVDAAVFYTEYKDYLSFEPINPITFQMGNKLSGKTYGFELSTVWQPTASWQLSANYSYTNVDMGAEPDSLDPLSVNVLNGSFANNMFKLHSAWDITPKWSLDTWIYYIDDVPVPSNYALFENISTSDAIKANARLAWRAQKDLEVALTAKNIFDDSNLESVGEAFSTPTEIERSIELTVSFSF